ncbi:hypothetical protein [Amycolatopsis sp. MtRt-6]|uniref:hypothetical protein n=1 Tax=Amycolatopsis sp. MtRt-6 TaxID=2792782 RepID=UPI001A8D8EC7|nr:hypothetical protein [Amycolatopsis sp. MtRt-6]
MTVPERLTLDQGLLLALLVVDTVLLALLEMFFLPLRIGVVPVPVTVLVGAVTTPWLVWTTAKLVRPGLSWVPLAVWVLVVFGVGLQGPGGDRLLIQDWRALLLLGASALPAAMVLGGGPRRTVGRRPGHG